MGIYKPASRLAGLHPGLIESSANCSNQWWIVPAILIPTKSAIHKRQQEKNYLHSFRPFYNINMLCLLCFRFKLTPQRFMVSVQNLCDLFDEHAGTLCPVKSLDLNGIINWKEPINSRWIWNTSGMLTWQDWHIY